jgi:hypothetical protein
MGEARRVPSLPSDQNQMFPRPERASGFPRWGFARWLVLYVEDTLGRLPMLLLGPVLGAVVGTAVAVSELGTVRIGGRLAAAPPSVWDVLWPAVLGGVGGIIVLTLLAAGWGIFSYCRYGDDTWEVVIDRHPSGSGGELVQLVCKGEVQPIPISSARRRSSSNARRGTSIVRTCSVLAPASRTVSSRQGFGASTSQGPIAYGGTQPSIEGNGHMRSAGQLTSSGRDDGQQLQTIRFRKRVAPFRA